VIPAIPFGCAPNVSPVTLAAIVKVESHGAPLALHVNGLRGPQPKARDAKEAAGIAEGFIARGYSVDVGLTQTNSRNLPALGLTVAQALDPCANIRAGGAILAADYGRAVAIWGEGQTALRAALRMYNTGRFDRGWAYLARYGVPALDTGARVTRAAAGPARPNPYTANQDVYSRLTVTAGSPLDVRID
jgi:type IV secretion system protein VirB1